jgi:uncharacterized membrane protein YoaK (UPF0700 family)
MRRSGDGTGVRDLLLVALTVSTGAVDSITWLVLGKVFSAFMTGNVVFLGIRAGGADGPSVPRVLAAIAGFAAGTAVSAVLVGRKRGHDEIWPRGVTRALAAALAVQAGFLALWLGVDSRPSGGVADGLLALSALAMGVQTTAVFSLGVRAVFTTAATATLTVLMGDLSAWSKSGRERRRLGAVVTALFTGAVIGALLVEHARTWAPVFPLAVSAFVVATAARAFGGRPTPARGVAARASRSPSRGDARSART